MKRSSLHWMPLVAALCSATTPASMAGSAAIRPTAPLSQPRPMEVLGSSQDQAATIAGDFAYVIHGIDIGPSQTGRGPKVEAPAGTELVTVDLSIENLTGQPNRLLTPLIKLVDRYGRVFPSIEGIEAARPVNDLKYMRFASKAIKKSSSGQSPVPETEEEIGAADEAFNAIVLAPGAPLRRRITFIVPNDAIGGEFRIDVPIRGLDTMTSELIEHLAAERKTSGLTGIPSSRDPVAPGIVQESARIPVRKFAPPIDDQARIGDRIERGGISWTVLNHDLVDVMSSRDNPLFSKKPSEGSTILAVEYSMENLTNKTIESHDFKNGRYGHQLALRDAKGRCFASKSLPLERSPGLLPGIPAKFTAWFPIPTEVAEGPFSVVLARASRKSILPEYRTGPLPLAIEIRLDSDSDRSARTIAGLPDFTAAPRPQQPVRKPSTSVKDLNFLEDRVSIGRFAYTIHDLKALDQDELDRIGLQAPPTGTRFLILDHTVENISGATSYPSSEYYLIDADGSEFRIDQVASHWLATGLLNETHPGVPVRLPIVFTVLEDSANQPLRLRLAENHRKSVEIDLSRKRDPEPIDADQGTTKRERSIGHVTPAEEIQDREAPLGARVDAGDFAYVFKGHRTMTSRRLRSQTLTPPDGTTFLLVDYQFENLTDRRKGSLVTIDLVDGKGRSFGTSSFASLPDRMPGSLEPGESKRSSLAYVVPEEILEGPLVLEMSIYSDEVEGPVRIRLK